MNGFLFFTAWSGLLLSAAWSVLGVVTLVFYANTSIKGFLVGSAIAGLLAIGNIAIVLVATRK